MKRKICIVCPIWQSGGIESFLFNTLSRMDLQNTHIDIVAERMGESLFTEPLQRMGVRFVPLSGNTCHPFQNYRRFRALLKTENYSVLHLNAFQGMNLFYSVLAKRAGVGTRILHSHNSGLRDSPLKPLKLLIHKLSILMFARSGTAMWACSEQAAKFMFPAGLLAEHGYSFIPNGIDTQRFRFDPVRRKKLRTELGLENSFVIGNVGRLCSQKNQVFLLEVLQHIFEKRPDCCLLLIGDGPDRELLQKKADTLHLRQHLLLYGVSYNVEDLLCAMDVFMLPSKFEGLSISALEAQASGLPLICNDALSEETSVLKDRCIALPLLSQKWANAAFLIPGADREKFAPLLREAGFDISQLAHNLENEYLSASEIADS